MKIRRTNPSTVVSIDGDMGCRRCPSCPLENLKVALIGGLDRLEDRYCRSLGTLGAEVSFHTGQCAGGGATRLRSLACNADIVIFITTVNSHNALQVVKSICKKSGKRFMVMRETGPERIKSALEQQVQAWQSSSGQ